MRLFAALSLALLVASPALTQIPGPKKDGSTLLPNGWSIRPHGRQIPLESDLPIRAAWHPGGRILAIQHAGYREHRIVLFDAKSEKKLGKIELPRTWSGMCWHPGGDWLFVSGGTADVVHGFEIDTKDWTVRSKVAFDVGTEDVLDLPAGLCADAQDRLWIPLQRSSKLVRVSVGGVEDLRIDLEEGSFPFECLLHDGKLFVSLWAQKVVAVFDAETGKPLARILPATIRVRCVWTERASASS
jgi:WD40 repeat protein